MNTIKRDVYVLRNTIKIPIEVTKGTDAISFEFTVRDYNLPVTAAAVAYAYRGGMKKPNSTLCNVEDNVISFQPSANFFEVGNNELQIRVINEDKSLISFKEKVKCSDSMGFPDEEEEADKSLIEQIIAQSGKESGERKAADEKERSERKTADETEKSERIAADAKEKSERQKEIATERARIDQLTKMGEGGTTGDAELADIRVGNEGATYSNAGNAVRSQTKDVPAMMDNLQSPYVDISLLEQGSLNNTGTEITSSKVLRSVEFHWNKNGKITAPSGYKIAIANYAMQSDESGQMLQVYQSATDYGDSQTSSKADGDTEFRRLLIKRSDGADINAEDLRGKITTNVPGLRAMDVIENMGKHVVGAPYTCYPMSELVCMFSTPEFNKKYPFGTFVAKTEYDAGTITTDGTSITLRYQLTNNITVDETNGLCAIIENNAGVSYEISITDDNEGRFGSTLYSGTLEKGSNIIPLAGNTYACTHLYMLINGHSSISAAELNSIKFSLAKVDNMTYPNTISRKHIVGAPYTCYPMSELVCMFSTPEFNKKYPFGTFVAKTEYDAGTITTDGTSITLRYQLTNNITVDETNGLCAIIENNAGVSYEISITDDNEGRFGSTLYSGTLEKGSNIIPLAGNTYACTHLYMLINGHSSISAAELNSIKFSLAKVPNVSHMTPIKQEQLVAFIGDSLTAQGYYTKMKSHDFKYNVYAIGGQGINGILSRTNTIDLQITSPAIITNDAELIFVNGAPINNQGDGNIGALMLNGNIFNIEYTADNKVIAKNVKSPITNSGETIKTSICDTDFALYVYWCGTNNMQGGNVDFFIQSFEQIIATHPNSLILGITWDTSNMGLELVKAIDEAATKKFGNRFLPLHDNIVKYGLSYNGLTPTSEDTEAINNNLIPPMLRADQVHFNAYGQTYVAHLVQERMRTLGVK